MPRPGPFLKRHAALFAVLWCVALPFLFAPGLVLRTSAMGPERVLDSDALFGFVRHVRVRPYDDSTPIHLDYPRDAYLSSRLHQGHVDLWNPLEGFGVPVLPDPGGLLFPLRLIYYAWPSAVSYVILRLLRLSLAGLGAYFLARSRRLSIPAAVGAASLFELCGGMLVQAAFMTTTPTAMLPWVVLGMELVRQQRWRVGIAALASAVALTIYGGHQTLVAVTCLGGGAYGLGAAIAARKRAPRLLGVMALGVVLGLLLSGPALFPFVELLKHGHSYKWIAKATSNWHRWVLEVRRDSLVGFAAPLFVGQLRDKLLVTYPYVFHDTVGLIAISLACVALATRRWGVPLLSVFLVGVVFAFVPPGFSLIGHTRFLRDVLPRYFWPLFVLPVTQWAGGGADVLARLPRVARLRASRPWWLLARVAMIGVGGAGLLWGLAFWAMTDRRYRFLAILKAHELRLALPVLALAGVTAAALAVFGRRPKWLRATLLAAAVIELGVYVRPLVSEPPSSALGRPIPAPALELSRLVAQQHGRIAAVSRNLSIAQTPLLAKIADSRMTSPLVPERYAAYMGAGGARTDVTYYSIPVAHRAFLDLCAVRYIMGWRSGARYLYGDHSMPHVFDTHGASIYENLAGAPRARLVHRTRIEPDLVHAERALRAALRGRAHLQRTPLFNTAILEPTPGGRRPAALHGGPTEAAEIVRAGAERVEVRTRSHEAGYLVLADQYYPGWRAYVDGRRQPIYPAYVAFRAVYVPAGSHVVVFKYLPASVWLGCGAFVLGLLGLLLSERLLRDRAKNTGGRSILPSSRAPS